MTDSNPTIVERFGDLSGVRGRWSSGEDGRVGGRIGIHLRWEHRNVSSVEGDAEGMPKGGDGIGGG